MTGAATQAAHLPSPLVAIIGAGPAGLSVAARLKRAGARWVLVDKGQIGDSWSRMPSGLRLVSPWWTNALALTDMLRHRPFSMVSAHDYAAYLRDFAEKHQVVALENRKVSRIRRQNSKAPFEIEFSSGTMQADVVVMATGYFSSPAGPSPPVVSDGSVPAFHAGQYPGAEALKSICAGKAALILGRRISAGQLLVDLADAGQMVAVSARQPIEFRRDGLAGRAKDFLYYFYEELLLSFRPRLQAPSFPVMDGDRARELIESRTVSVHGPVAGITDGVAHFTDGSELSIGAVIYATGYRPSIPDLSSLPLEFSEDGLPICQDWQAVNVPGLFFIGLDNRMNYRSRTIRGIRSDAPKVSTKILEMFGSESFRP